MSLMALARFLPISMPECPPARPEMTNWYANPLGFGTFSMSISVILFTPPAQEASKVPSSSESKLMRISPFTCSGSSDITPSIPVSSDVVKSAMTLGCWSDLSSSKLMAIATAMPLSAPSVVPFVLIQSPSTTSGIGCVLKSKSNVSSFTQTISV